MHLNIAICEDHYEDLCCLKHFADDFFQEQNLPSKIVSFSDGEAFLAVHKTQPFDIVFMDIFLDNSNGMAAAQQACSLHPLQIIFTTCSREHAIEAFGINAAHYLIKPLTEAAVRQALERSLLRLNLNYSRQIPIKTSRGIVSIPVHNIIYIEVFNKICLIHTEKNTFQTYSSLDALFELLDDAIFMRAQRSYIVNMNYIDIFYFDHIQLTNGLEIILSRNNRSDLKKQYQQFLFQLARRGNL